MHVFVDAILAGTAPAEVLPNFEVGLAVQRVMDGAERSAASGQWVDLR
jgi:predicted dehydrogenase